VLSSELVLGIKASLRVMFRILELGLPTGLKFTVRVSKGGRNISDGRFWGKQVSGLRGTAVWGTKIPAFSSVSQTFTSARCPPISTVSFTNSVHFLPYCDRRREALGAFWNVIAALPSERLTPSSLGVDAKKPIRAVRSVTRRLARPAAESRHGGLYVLLPFLIYLLFKMYFNDSCQTNYLKI